MDFVFTAGEQEFYSQKGFTNEPSRCPSCRQQRKASGGGRGSRDSYGDRGGYSSGGYSDRGSYSSGGGGGYSDRGSREMHSATCASCGREALVPFVPRGDKPVYCSDCFQQQRGGGSSSRGGRW
jgi:CxxC-x17-CxxC domain-containing protein